jgi:hypothetical protein
MKKLVWRLGKLPSPDEVRELVKDKIITQEEARDILFREDEPESNDPPDSARTENLKAEIKFLRELVEQLSKDRRSVVTEYIYKTIPSSGTWTYPYTVYCSNTAGSSQLTYTTGTTGLTGSSFTDISTF